MTTRKQIVKKAEKLNAIIKKAKSELIELQKQDYLLCDKQQWFTEKEETTGRGKHKKTRLIGRVHWMQSFHDEDIEMHIEFERSHIVRIDGVWQF